ncbi:unannotated protein [freshwater metagenome]|uniref:Unannotated protein n=1 Tax=freshwater metagenome TaxID=449393 RepID=A0A6J7FLC9_9ZZZZ|nr:HNH endonuclease [Actinomycetota bacterium]
MSTETLTFPLSTWTRDWSRPKRSDGTAFFRVEDRGYATPCWVWQGATKPTGYGQVRFEGRTLQAHRAVFVDTHGEIPQGLELDHLCHVRSCCNPAHLEPVRHDENLRRRIRPFAPRAPKTHCPQGHPYSGANLYRSAGDPRKQQCRTCHKAAMRRYRARLAEKVAAA